MPATAYQHILDNFANQHCIILGDIMIDAYQYGTIDRISPEAPIPVVNTTSKNYKLGGAANVAANIKALGAIPHLLGVVGQDTMAALMLQELQQQDIHASNIIIDTSRPTTVKTRIIVQNKQVIRLDEEKIHYITQELQEEILQRTTQLIEQYPIDCIILEDYDKGVITPYLIQKIIDLAKKNNIPTLADPKNRQFYNYNEITLFKPNLKEIIDATTQNIDIQNIQTLESVVNKLKNILNNQIYFITLSEFGIYVSDANSSTLIPARTTNIIDVTGAGDVVVAVAALCLKSKTTASNIAKICNVAGSLACEKMGSVTITTTQIVAELEYYLVDKNIQ